MKVRKFREDLGYGRYTNRVAYVIDPINLPPSTLNSDWREDLAFDERTVVSDDPSFQRIIEVARERGLAIVNRSL